MFKNIVIFKIGSDWQLPSAERFEEQLQRQRFAPCEPTQEESSGWVPPRPQDHSPLLEVVGGQWILKLQTERKSVPAGAVKAELDARCKALEATEGRKPSRKAKKELKEDIILEFLPRAFSKRQSVLVWIDAINRFLVVSSASHRVGDLVVDQLVEAFARADAILPLQNLATAVLPAQAMAQWLTEREAPVGFTVDRELELREPDNDQALVRYARHSLDIEEVVQHVVNGKMPVQLALTWEGRVSFMLGADLALRKIELLDDVFVDAEEGSDFDGDVALTTGELSRLLPALVEVLGGEAATSPVADESGEGAHAAEPLVESGVA